jgi:hypothetical protein
VLQVAQVEQVNNLLWSEIKQKTPQRKPTCLGPKVEAGIGEGRQRQVYNTFMGPEPAELRVLRELTGNLSEVCHQLFDFPSDKVGAEHFGSLTNQLVASAQGKCDSRTERSIRRCKNRCRKGILGAGMNRIAARAIFERKSGVATFERNDALSRPQ